MLPPYEVTPAILGFVASVSKKIGTIDARFLNRSSPLLRKRNQIKTIHASLQIEGNTLSLNQVTALLENKRVLGPLKDITEVVNAIEVYKKLDEWDFRREKHFLAAHTLLMKGLMKKPGVYRHKTVGIVKGQNLQHLAPPAHRVPVLMKELFQYLKSTKELTLIMSCVFHYEMEFIHPFMDGNGRMGRLWQTVILVSEYPLFAHLPFETLISKNQKHYYNALAQSDKEGRSTKFIEFMLSIIDRSIDELLKQSTKRLTATERIDLFLSEQNEPFTRKDYRNKFPDLSTASASRDLKLAVTLRLIRKRGNRNRTAYEKN